MNINIEKAYFCGGCFWGMQYHFAKTTGVISTAVGYMGGHIDNPSYQDVCTGKTGHYEAIEVVFNTSQINYEQLTKLFFEIHDFSQADGQGPDIGPQYESAIFYINKQQEKAAKDIILQLAQMGYRVETEVLPFAPFYRAEDYHQHYYEIKKSTPYCHAYRKIFTT